MSRVHNKVLNNFASICEPQRENRGTIHRRNDNIFHLLCGMRCLDIHERINSQVVSSGKWMKQYRRIHVSSLRNWVDLRIFLQFECFSRLSTTCFFRQIVEQHDCILCICETKTVPESNRFQKKKAFWVKYFRNLNYALFFIFSS